MTLATMLIILLVVAVAGGGWTSTTYGWASWSPVGVLLFVLLILFLMGRI
jgi:hypothetical protein